MKRFDQELTDLQHRLVQMAERAESMLALAVDSLESIEDETRENIHQQEQELDQMQIDVDQEVGSRHCRNVLKMAKMTVVTVILSFWFGANLWCVSGISHCGQFTTWPQDGHWIDVE